MDFSAMTSSIAITTCFGRQIMPNVVPEIPCIYRAFFVSCSAMSSSTKCRYLWVVVMLSTPGIRLFMQYVKL